jgi:hypothetical protein
MHADLPHVPGPGLISRRYGRVKAVDRSHHKKSSTRCCAGCQCASQRKPGRWESPLFVAVVAGLFTLAGTGWGSYWAARGQAEAAVLDLAKADRQRLVAAYEGFARIASQISSIDGLMSGKDDQLTAAEIRTLSTLVEQAEAFNRDAYVYGTSRGARTIGYFYELMAEATTWNERPLETHRRTLIREELSLAPGEVTYVMCLDLPAEPHPC